MNLPEPLLAVTLDDLHAFASDLAESLAPISVGGTLAAVRSLMRFASRSGYLPKSVAADLNLPRSENRLAERILSEEDARRITALETDPCNRVLLLLYTAGLRVSEACNLHWRNLTVRGDKGQLTICGKGGKTRAVLLPPEMWKDLGTLSGSADHEGLYSVREAANRWTVREFCALCKRPQNGRGSWAPSARTGCGTRTPPTVWNEELPFISCRLPQAMLLSPRRAATCMRVQASPARSAS